MIRRLPHGMRLVALLALLAALLVAGCGGDDEGATDAAGPSPATVAPADSAVYGQVIVRPTGAMEGDVVAAARKVLRVDDPGAELRRLVDRALADEPGDESYAHDYEPWLGESIAIFVTIPASGDDDPDVGVIVSSRDDDALADEIDRQRDEGELRPGGSYEGVEYDVDRDDGTPSGIVGDFLVLGTTMRAFRSAVDASRGSSLADESRYKVAVDEVDGDALAFLYADPRPIVAAVRGRSDVEPEAQELLASPQFAQAEPVTVSLTADADEIALESTTDLVPRTDGSSNAAEVTVGQLPADAWVALATPPLGPIVRQLIDSTGSRAEATRALRGAGFDLDRDLLDPLGGLGLFVRGSNPLDIGGGVLLQMTDADAAQRLVTRAQAILRAGLGAPTRSVELSGGRGFEVQIPQSPQPIVVLAKGDKVAAGYAASSATDLLDPQQRFDDSSAGKAAIATLGDDFAPSFVLLAPPLVALLRSLDQLQVADLSDVLPYLSAYESLAIGTERGDDATTVRVVAALR